MNEHGIEELIGTIYEMVQDAKNVPFSGGNCSVERERVLDLLDEISNKLPGELKQARTICESRDTMITNAKREAEAIKKAAHAEAKQMVAREAVCQEAEKQAAQMLQDAKEKIKELKQLTLNYVDDSLRETEENIAKALAEVRDSRAKFSAVVNPQPVVRNSAIIEDV